MARALHAQSRAAATALQKKNDEKEIALKEKSVALTEKSVALGEKTKALQDAEDALQGAFSRIAAKPKLLARADAPWPYLIRTVRNEALRILQKRRHTSSTDVLENSVGHHEDTETALVFEETTESVRRVLKTLPQNQYEVVILKHWEELTFAEIAEALDLSQNTVASRYRYAMEKLQRSLEPLIK